LNTLVFDIETVPDTDLGRRLYDLRDLSDEHVAQIMFTKRRQETGSEFLSHEQQRIVAISVVMRSRESLKVWSLGDEASSEKHLIERFFDGLDKFTPDLVSWNGAGFDLPVLHYRSLLHSVTAARYWELGDSDQSFRYSNYLSRFHWRHMDLMDILSGFQGRACKISPPCWVSPGKWACMARKSGAPTCRAASRASAIIAKPTCSTLI
jgi:predicted PolB exonuclease-like 3'-5' exonuclease